jgi:hypothetical protein
MLNKHPNKSRPADWFGDYYAWGEIIPNKPNGYTWDTYEFKKYNKIDNITELLPEDDAAYQNIHIGNYKFHIPTVE